MRRRPPITFPNAQRRGQLLVVGVTHHAAPVELRERIAIDADQWYAGEGAGAATLLLSTCNRLEIYAWSETSKTATLRSRVQRALAETADVSEGELRPYLSSSAGTAAVAHLIRVAAGLDSLVVGENQIRGQVRHALKAAAAAQPRTGPDGLPSTLEAVFNRALESARRIRNATPMSHHPSIAAAAVDVAARCPELGGSLRGKFVLVLGAGLMAKSAARTLVQGGARVRMLNRSAGHARIVTESLGPRAEAGALSELPDLLAEADLVVGATASRQPVISGPIVDAAVGQRHGRPLVLVDIALPRDIEPVVRASSGVRLIDLDDLEALCPIDSTTRRHELALAESAAEEEAEKLTRWLRIRAMSPAIAALRAHGEKIRLDELQRSARRLRDLTPEQQAAVAALTSGIVNKLLHDPTVALREAAARPRATLSEQVAWRSSTRSGSLRSPRGPGDEAVPD